MSELEDRLTKLRDAIQEFANGSSELKGGGPVLVDISVVVWEEVSYNEEGNINREVRYSVPSDNWSPSAAVGVLRIAGKQIEYEAMGPIEGT